MLGVTAVGADKIYRNLEPRKLALIGAFSTLLVILYILFRFTKRKFVVAVFRVWNCRSGIGLGLAYVTPVATVSKWFPDKQGLVTGMVVMGFGLRFTHVKTSLPDIFRIF